MLCRVVGSNSNKKDVFVFFSGFGADYNFWNDLLPYFSSHKCVLLSENYFCEDSEVEEEKLRKLFYGKRIIGVGHSLGYMKLCKLQEKYDFFKLSKIISIEGFSNYLGDFEPLKSYRKMALDYMKLCYYMNPITTLTVFQTMCGAFPEAPDKIDKRLLLEDLDLLDEKITSPSIPHLVLSSLDDFVVPFFIIHDNFNQNAKIVYTQFASHILGIRHPKYVYDEIMKFV